MRRGGGEGLQRALMDARLDQEERSGHSDAEPPPTAAKRRARTSHPPLPLKCLLPSESSYQGLNGRSVHAGDERCKCHLPRLG